MCKQKNEFERGQKSASRGHKSVYKRKCFNKYFLKLYLNLIRIKDILFFLMTIFTRITRNFIFLNIIFNCQIEVLLVEVRRGGSSFQRNND